jgi:hypothetical protein
MADPRKTNYWVPPGRRIHRQILSYDVTKNVRKTRPGTSEQAGSGESGGFWDGGTGSSRLALHLFTNAPVGPLLIFPRQAEAFRQAAAKPPAANCAPR